MPTSDTVETIRLRIEGRTYGVVVENGTGFVA